MDQEKVKKSSVEEESQKPSPAELAEAKRILKFFDTAFSAMKLYPPGNPSVEKTIDIFCRELKKFLEEHEELRIGIEEFNFLYKGEVVLQDEEKKRSLPFFLFKDGMRELSFIKNLEIDELRAFLVTLKTAIDLPSEESDVVSLLWEKDFVNIRYFVLDEYLDLSISGDERMEVDLEELTEGKVVLAQHDLAALSKESAFLSFASSRAAKKEGEGEGELDGSPADFGMDLPVIEKDEAAEVESIISKSRKVGVLDELMALLFEILYFEKDAEHLSNVLQIFTSYFQKIVREGNFSLAVMISTRIQDLKIILSGKSEEKLKMLEDVEKKVRDRKSVEMLKKMFLEGKIEDADSFFRYLSFMKEDAIPVAGLILEKAKDYAFRESASRLLKEVGQKNIAALLYFAKGSNVTLAKEIISLSEKIEDEKVIRHLEEFVSYPNKEIRLQVVRVLGKIGNQASNRILLRFLSDDEDTVRETAAEHLKYFDDKESYDLILGWARDKEFRKRTQAEKKALLAYLANKKSDEVYGLLRSILKKWSLFSPSKYNETKLAAVSALEAMATPGVKEILEEGAKSFNKKISGACLSALSRMR